MADRRAAGALEGGGIGEGGLVRDAARLDLAERLVRPPAAAVGAVRGAEMQVGLGQVERRAMLDRGHRLDQRGTAEGDAGAAAALVLHRRDVVLAVAVAPVHRGIEGQRRQCGEGRARRHGGGERGLVDDDAEPAAQLVVGQGGERRDARLPSGIGLGQGLRKRRESGGRAWRCPSAGIRQRHVGISYAISLCPGAHRACARAHSAVRRARRRPTAAPGRPSAWPWPAATCRRRRRRTAAPRPG